MSAKSKGTYLPSHMKPIGAKHSGEKVIVQIQKQIHQFFTVDVSIKSDMSMTTT